MDRNTGKSRGFGYVEFTTSEAVEAALKMNGKEIDGRPVNIDKSTGVDKKTVQDKRAKSFGDSTSPPSSVLFVGNLSFNANEDALWEVFAEYGDIKSVRVPTDRESGRAKGFAYVEFTDLDAAKKALETVQGQDIAGRAVRLDYSQPRDNSGGGGGFGGRGGGRGGFDGGRGGFGGGRGGFGGRVSTFENCGALSPMLMVYDRAVVVAVVTAVAVADAVTSVDAVALVDVVVGAVLVVVGAAVLVPVESLRSRAGKLLLTTEDSSGLAYLYP